MPVPAGISLPMITFSLRPSRLSLLPWMAASVSTLVVSWKEAADSHDSVASEALVMPMSTGRAEAGSPPPAAARRVAVSGRGRPAAPGYDPAVLGLEDRPLDQRARQELRGARVDDRHPLEHLADDHLDVLVVDRHALAAVDLLDLAHQVQLHLARAHDPQHLVRVHRTLGELLADLDVGTVLDPQPRPTRQLVVDDLVGAVVRGDGQLAELLAVLDPDAAGQLGDRGLALGAAGPGELHPTRPAVGDVLTRDTTGVEGAHRQLGAGLTDRLGGDDADRLADVDELAGGQRAAVAGRAGPPRQVGR